VGKAYFSMLKRNEPYPLNRYVNLALLSWDYHRILSLMFSLQIIACTCALLLVSCGSSPTVGGFGAASPAARSKAIQTAAIMGNLSAVKKIVEQLDSDDPAIRMMAIEALERLTGETYGYKHYDPTYVRREAIAKWVDAVQNGSVPKLAHSPAAFRDNP